MKLLDQVNENLWTSEFVFAHRLEKKESGNWHVTADIDGFICGPFAHRQMALDATSDDTSARIEGLTGTLGDIAKAGLQLFQAKKLAPAVEARVRTAEELLEQWANRPGVFHAQPIEVAHMDDPQEYREDESKSIEVFHEFAKNWAAKVHEFLVQVEAEVLPAGAPEIPGAHCRWARLRAVVVAESKLERDMGNRKELQEFLASVPDRSDIWWYDQRNKEGHRILRNRN